ncbi:universal stress protein [soil metagenome]
MMTILVPTDFSANAENASRFAMEMAKETKSRILLMHTYETPVLYSDIPLLEMKLDFKTIRNSALERLKKFYNKLIEIAPGVKVEMLLCQGLASARIEETALEKKADLIVMGTTGNGAVERVLIGSNTSRVIRNAPCMVLAVPPRAKFNGLKKMVYATNLLTDNLRHTKAILPLAKTFNAEIIFLTVNTSAFVGSEDEDLKKMTGKIKGEVRYPKISGYVCENANVANGINYFIKKQKADCLVMYTYHRSMLSKIFNSSITKAVAIHTSIPLLVIHDTDFTQDPD